MATNSKPPQNFSTNIDSKPIVYTLSFLLMILVAMYKYLWLFDFTIAPIYDMLTLQHPITTVQQLEVNYHSFPIIYKETGLKSGKKYDDFLVVTGLKRYKYVVGKLRIKDFLPKDRLLDFSLFGYKINKIPIWNLEKREHILLKKELLIKLLELQNELKKAGHDEYALQLTSGYRDPEYNKSVGGAKKSRHMHGDAMDISVRDINRDGKINLKDRKVVYDILNKKVIGNKGGIGTYKRMPRVIHFDTRGHRARW